MAVPACVPDRSQLRRKLRKQRRKFSGPQRTQAEARVTATLLKHRWLARPRNIGIYLAFDGELDLAALVEVLSRQRKQLFAPQLGHSPRGMCFIHCGRGTMAPNAYGISEPVSGQPVDPRSLDLVLVPLVAFDTAGTRLGMGGGHYDRLFSFLNHRRQWRHPKLLGVGFELQRQRVLPRAPWDVSLDGAVTEQGCYFF